MAPLWRLRYRFDDLVYRSTSALIGWFTLICLRVVVPMSVLLVRADRRPPETFTGQLVAVWVSVGQTLKLDIEAPPARDLLVEGTELDGLGGGAEVLDVLADAAAHFPDLTALHDFLSRDLTGLSITTHVESAIVSRTAKRLAPPAPNR
ncbi:hypothetical protein [Streptomyces sp. NPDC056682]|uniref:hypothetical protein n=1 Tax=Streptomyces sp. NPDC056682 TaxID=3345909 RepID=UPI0036AF99A3